MSAGQVHLGHVAGDDDLRPRAHAGQEHLHLRRGRVLRLVQDDERVLEGPAAHVGQRHDLDHVGVDVALHLAVAEHLLQRVVERPQVGVDLGLEVAGQEPELLAGLDRRAGEDDLAELPARSAATASATAR